jgi:hypothetical protein
MRNARLAVGTALVAAGVLVAQVGAASSSGPGEAHVTSSANDGPGSFRAAIALASGNASVTGIVVTPGLGPIELQTGVVYTGEQSLRVLGHDAVIDAGALADATQDALRFETGGDVAVSGLTVRNAPGEGLVYEVPSNASGVNRVSLADVAVLDNEGHGVLINDQEDPEDVENSAGSAASLDVSVMNARFAGNGFGALDRDGLRVNEGGAGDLEIVIRNTGATANGADGIELDERGQGDAVFVVSGTQLAENGSFDVTEEDLDDGMDVDESDDGSLVGSVFNSSSNGNLEEGWDFNENNLGNFRVDMAHVAANRNRQEGVDFEEDDGFSDFPAQEWGGDLAATLNDVTTGANGSSGDAGLKIRERSAGGITASIRGAQASDNETRGISLREQEAGDLEAAVDWVTAAGNDSDGVLLREDDGGRLAGSVDGSTTDGNGGDGVEFDENGMGDLTARATRGSSSMNSSAGVRADEGGDGSGTLALVNVLLTGNAAGPFVSNVPVTQT